MSTNIGITFYPAAANPFSRADRQPLNEAAEYSMVLAELTADQPRSGLDLYIGGELRESGIDLHGTVSYPFAVEDYCGVLRWELRDPHPRPLSLVGQGEMVVAAELLVVPGKLTLADVAAIKERRIPQLLAALNARNAMRLRYDADDDRPYHFYSLPYSVDRLLYFSRALLDGSSSLSERIYRRLSYRSEAERLISQPIRGSVRWAATATRWANQPATTGLLHDIQREVKDYDTPLNRVFVTIHRRIATQAQLLASQLERSHPTIAADLRRRASRHREVAGRKLLAQVQPLQIGGQIQPLQVNNPAYTELLSLWRDFATRYVTLDPAAHLSGLQPMHKIYELWCVCEVAAALGLQQDAATLQRGATFSGNFAGQRVLLSYDQPVTGWFSRQLAKSRAPRPDILLEVGDRRLVLDVKYRIDNEHARTDDMMKLLAYMNDLDLQVGGIIYPGSGDSASYPEGKGKVIYELPLRPTEDFGAMSAQLGTQLVEVVNNNRGGGAILWQF